MENKSLIQGSTWYWRKTYANIPMHGEGNFAGRVNIRELCLVIDTPDTTQKITEELGKAGIHIQQKEVHLASKNIPEGSKVLYVREPNKNIEDDESDFEDAEENLQKLKNYIFQNGGKIDGESQSFVNKKMSFNLFSLFRKERK